MKCLTHLSRAAALFTVCILLSGCLQVRYLVRVNKDGSGTVEERMLLSSEMMQMMQSMRAAFADEEDEPEPMPGLFDEDQLRTRAMRMGQGVEYVSGQQHEEAGFEGYIATYRFADINQLSLDMRSATEGSGDGMMPSTFEMPGAAGARFAFVPGSPATLTVIREGQEEPDYELDMDEEDFDFDFEMDEDYEGEWSPEEHQEDTAEMMEQMSAMFTGLSFAFEVEVEGDIRETTAVHHTGSRVTIMEIDFGKLLADAEGMEAFMNMNQLEDLEEAEAIERMNALPGMRVEPRDEIRIVFD